MKQIARNPVLPVSVCVADGEPHVFGDRVYLFGSHDKPGGESFCLKDYEFFSAPLNDLSDWTSHGTNYSAKQDPLYGENAKYLYAPDVVRGNDGRYYLYYCLAGWKGKGGYSHPISVAVCDTPDGKYEYYGMVKKQDGMLTLKELPKRIADTSDFKGHTFFEGSSIRKIGDTYYFVYSSEKNHELCYATSNFPDRDFHFRGTLVSNGDVGYHGRTERKRCNATGTTHGGMEQIGDKWYIFYHRLTHGSDYSRQMCAEQIEIMPDGSIAQVEMTSRGLNNSDLPGVGEYPAAICCNLTNGKMPHIANRSCKDIPCITHSGEEYFVGYAAKGTQIMYKYFSVTDGTELYVTARGTGKLQVYLNNNCIGDMSFHEAEWKTKELRIGTSYKHAEIKLFVKAGKLDVLSLGFGRFLWEKNY